MINDFRDIIRDDNFDKDQHIGLWNKYVTHIFSSNNTLSKIADLTSIHQYQLNLIEYRFHELLKSFTTYIEYFFAKKEFDNQEVKDFLISRVSKPRYDNLFAEVLLRDDLQKKFDPETKLLNNFITELLFKRETNIFVNANDLDKFAELKSTSDFSNVIEKLNLYIQDRKHSNLIIELIDLYFRGEINSLSSWDNLTEELKERVSGVSNKGRNPYEEYPQDIIENYVRNCLHDKNYIWNTPKKKGKYKIAKIATELLEDEFDDVESPMTYEAMILRVNKAIHEIEKTK